MKDQVYSVPLIPPDLRREETILQIADTLDYLQGIINDIFGKITTRVIEYRKRLQAINKRADLAQAKINKIRGSSKATKVFSSYKYPGPDNLEEYSSVFSDIKDDSLSELPRSSIRVRTKHSIPNDQTLKEKLQFYNVRPSERKQSDAEITEEGLGRLPRELDSISILLLFNTSENPYKKYVLLDPLGAVTKTRKSIEEESEKRDLGDAPITMSGLNQVDAGLLEKENYFYTPGMGQVPEMDVPLALPDLPGIADDMLYSAELGPSIAPSFPNMTFPELPSVVPDIASPSFNLTSPPPPPPPPPPSDLPLPPEPPTSAEMGMTSPPPPPPPPPPMTITPESRSIDKTDSASETVLNQNTPIVKPTTDARANLLESIRNAGKGKLKSINERKSEAKKKKQEEKVAVSSSGDFMTDLFTKLQLRRKGISGTARPTDIQDGLPPIPSSSSSLGAMDRVSALIPPPPVVEAVSNDQDNEDWD